MVVGIDHVEGLTAMSRENLKKDGIELGKKIDIVTGDGRAGWPEHGECYGPTVWRGRGDARPCGQRPCQHYRSMLQGSTRLRMWSDAFKTISSLFPLRDLSGTNPSRSTHES